MSFIEFQGCKVLGWVEHLWAKYWILSQHSNRGTLISVVTTDSKAEPCNKISFRVANSSICVS